MTRRAAFAFLVLLLAGVLPCLVRADPATCPSCGAPLEPGARFCTRCGARIETSGTPAPRDGQKPRNDAVQVVATHDKQLTSAFGAIAYGETVRVDSILGSAFAVAPGEFVTDASLLVGAREVSLRTAGGRTVPARVAGIDTMIGVGLLRADLAEISPLTLRTGGLPRLGENLTAVGYPSSRGASRELVTSTGVVSGLHRGDLRIHPVEDYLQTDATLPAGFAGGPVLDEEGRVVGMSTAWVIGSQVVLGPKTGIGVSVPAAWVERGLEWIRTGGPRRAWIGAYTVPADTETRSRYGLPAEVRRIVEQVFPGSPAAAAGLSRGDGLLTFQGEPAASLTGLHDRLLRLAPGGTATVEIQRGREVRTVTLTLAERPDRPRLSAPDALRFYGGIEIALRGGKHLVAVRVTPGAGLLGDKIVQGDELLSLLGKKDLENVERANARWRPVRTVEELEERLRMSYSDFDFFVGLRFRSRDGARREAYIWDALPATDAL
jgi:serine protease Do